MSTQTLRSLEERLSREVPAISWHCEAGTSTQCVAGTDLPVEIHVLASKQGVPVKGSPFHLSGECLKRWGIDASANAICNELGTVMHSVRRRNDMDWDRLSEV